MPLPDEPEALGLYALMLLHDSRRDARVTDHGAIVTLEEQDRTRWDAAQIAEGTALLQQALRLRQPGPYQIQAAIAALHAEAPRAADTDWPQIAALYKELGRHMPSPVVELNRAVAVVMADGPRAGLRILDALAADDYLQRYHFYHVARADFWRRDGNLEQAASAYNRALELTKNAAERMFITRRLTEIAQSLSIG